MRAGAEGLAAGRAGALRFATLSLALSFRESSDFAVTGMASTAVSARVKAARRVACGVIKLVLDFMACSPFFITASRLDRALHGRRD